MATLDWVARLLDQTSKAEDKLESKKVLKKGELLAKTSLICGTGQQYTAIEELRVQFHHRSTLSFCTNSLAPIKYKPKTYAQKAVCETYICKSCA
jgi:hypothetical protein